MIAEAPELMLLDEPTDHLDIEAIAWLEAHLAASRTAFGVVSHDRAFLRHLTDRVLWVDRGEVRRLDRGFAAFEEWRDKVFEEEDQARHKMDRLLKAEGRWAIEGISARRKRNLGRVRRLAELRAERRDAILRPGTARLAFEGGQASGRMVVEAEHSRIRRAGDRRGTSRLGGAGRAGGVRRAEWRGEDDAPEHPDRGDAGGTRAGCGSGPT